MKYRHILGGLIISIAASTSGFAQYDPLYNQYNFDQLVINPAYAGIHDLMTMSVLFRQQWTNIDGAPRTYTYTGHTSVAQNKAGVGLNIISEAYGVNDNIEVFGSFAYKINFGRSILSAGLQGGYTSYTFNYGDLELEALDDPVFNPLTETVSQPNFGMGLWYMTDTYYAGLSIPRILKVEVDQDGSEPSERYQRHYYLSAGGIITLNNALKLKPYTLIRIIDNDDPIIELGGNLLINELIWAGLLYRNGAFAVMGQLELNNQLRLGLAVEIPTTELSKDTYGTYELMLTFDLEAFSTQVLKRRYF